MTIAVEPPEYFPPLARTALMQHVDHYVLADTFRYRRQTFHDRSKLRNPQGGHWISIPVFGQPEGAPLAAVDIETGGRWREKHWRSFLYDYRTTMYFPTFKDRLQSFFETTWTELADCTCRSIEVQSALLQLSTDYSRASSLGENRETRGQIARAVGADTLLVLEGATIGGIEGVDVRHLAFDHPTYHQNFEGFVSGMSAMDLVFTYGREARRLLSDATTITEESIA